MELGLRGRVALVVGATGGIGAAVARALAGEGCQLAVTARDAARADSLAAGLAREFGVAAAGFACDLAEAAAPQQCVRAVEQRFGRIDVLAMCAGNPARGSLTQVSEADWQATLEGKLMGSVRLVQAVLPGMGGRRHGRIVLVAGLHGRSPAAGGVIGGVSGAGLANLARSVAQEVAPSGVTVNVVDPHYTRTARWDRLVQGFRDRFGEDAPAAEARAAALMPIGRPIEPEEVADLVLFLASDRAAAITGAAIPIDGGAARGLY